MRRDRGERLHEALGKLGRADVDLVTLIAEASDLIDAVVPFDRTCWHTVDPGSVLFTGTVNRDVGCSGSWLAEHEYVIEDVNKWWFLARSGRRAGATSIATHGDLSRSARHRSHAAYGIGDELRVSAVEDGNYWGAIGLLRNADQAWFTKEDVDLFVSLSPVLATAFRRAIVAATKHRVELAPVADGPGVIVFDGAGNVESISPAAERWIEDLREDPKPATPAASATVQIVAARARTLHAGDDPLQLVARARVQTTSGDWLVIYGTPLSSPAGGDRVAVIIQPATPNEVAPLVALAYGLTPRETEVTRLCMQGRSTKEIATRLYLSTYTVQDHLKSVFDKTGVRSRNELVGQIFLEHYITRWEPVSDAPPEWQVLADPAKSINTHAEANQPPDVSARSI